MRRFLISSATMAHHHHHHIVALSMKAQTYSMLATATPLLQDAPKVRAGTEGLTLVVKFLPSLFSPTCRLPCLCPHTSLPNNIAHFSRAVSSSSRRRASHDESESGTEKQKVVIVESPSKAKTIQKYLGGKYIVLPTYGHVRDLAGRAGSVRPDEDYTLLWEVPSDALDPLDKIKAAVKNAKALLLATDPDREGEAIAWHVYEHMKSEGAFRNRQVKVLRATFNEITNTAVSRAINSARNISMPLVNAYIARRAIDHLIGFGLSPLLWRKLPGSRSAGRVQSAALALICDRERSIEDFIPNEYWTVEGDACLATESGKDSADRKESLPFKNTRALFPIVLTDVDGINLKQQPLDSELKARAMAERLSVSKFYVSFITKRKKQRKRPLPYITSTLQQDGLNKLRFSAKHTMGLAQQLYEGVDLGNGELAGLITYFLTDGFQLATYAVKAIRTFASERYGKEYVPADPPTFKQKVKNAQEAHEAIRPTDIRRVPSMLVNVLDEDALRLYSLIWSRTMACQMKQALYDDVTVLFTAEDRKMKLQSHDSSLCFAGFLAAMHDSEANLLKLEEPVDETAADEGEETKAERKLLELKKGDAIVLQKTDMHQHFTKPPPRFSEASLVMKLEELGIGRPSTYAQILMTLQSRNYVKVEKFYIFPEARGRIVTAFLSHFFPRFTDYKFTAKLEEQLDEVSANRVDWKDVLRGVWPKIKQDIDATMQIPVSKVVELLQETFANLFFKGLGMKTKVCPSCMTGNITLKLSRYGKGYYFSCDRSPSCRFKAEVISDEELDSLDTDPNETEVIKSVIPNNDRFIGIDPKTGRQIIVKLGPFGHYIQLGDDKVKTERPCFRIPDTIKQHEVTIEKAIELMKYPLCLGKHPENGDPIWLGAGKVSFHIKHRAAIVAIPKSVEPDAVSLEKALELLKGDNVRFRGRKASKNVTTNENKQGLKMAGKVSKLAQKESAKQKSHKQQEQTRSKGKPSKLAQLEGVKQKLIPEMNK